jgi:radical SAM protein with 4Fe4S-binding SPASM domain
MPHDYGEYLRRRISPETPFARLADFPRFFEIETVNACNARCPMCTIEDWNRHSPTMKDDLFDKLAAEISEHADEVIRVSLYRDGEPLLDKKLAERVEKLKRGGVCQVAISTNVSLLDSDRSRDLLEAGLDLIILSIDSLQKEIFEAIRVRLNFDEVLANALRFIELRNRLRPTTQIWVRMIRQQLNYDEWPAFEAFWKPRLATHDRVNYHNIHNWGNQLASFVPVALSTEPVLPCVALWSLMVIFANGDVPLCNVDYANKYSTGNVARDTIASVWQSPIMKERRSLHLSGRKGDISICENCNVWDEPPDRIHVAPEFAAKSAG